MKKIIAGATAAFLISGCAVVQPNLVKDESYNRTKTGATLGAITGAIFGAIKSKKHLKGAIVGAAAGAAVGGGIGYLLDKQANEIAEALGTGVNNDPLAALDPNKTIIVSKGEGYVKIMFRDPMMFAFNDYHLQPHAAEKVAKVAALLKRYPQTMVQIAGFTDSKGSYQYNYQLSLKRAQSVANYLRSLGVQNQIDVSGCSYNKPIVPNKDPRSRALNRRVEVYLYNDPAYRPNPCM